MDRSSPTVRLGRLVQTIPLSFFRILEAPFVYFHFSRHASPKMIVLLALPRSGSTLTYQVLCHGIHSIYLSNIGNLLYKVPYIGSKLSYRYCRDYQSNFTSKHGFVSGVCGPAEGLSYWRYWLGNGIDERQQVIFTKKKLSKRIKYLKNTFSVLSSSNNPIITGYLGHVLEWKTIREHFPEVIFIRLHRNPVKNAISLLKSRGDDPKKWFSVFPHECQEFEDLPVHEQVASQVYWLNRRLQDLNEDEKTIHIQYESLCESPEETLNTIIKFCKENDINILRKHTLPNEFKMRSYGDIYGKDVIKIKDALNRLEMKYGKLTSSY